MPMQWYGLTVICDNQEDVKKLTEFYNHPGWDFIRKEPPLSMFDSDPLRPWSVTFVSFQPFYLSGDYDNKFTGWIAHQFEGFPTVRFSEMYWFKEQS